MGPRLLSTHAWGTVGLGALQSLAVVISDRMRSGGLTLHQRRVKLDIRNDFFFKEQSLAQLPRDVGIPESGDVALGNTISGHGGMG